MLEIKETGAEDVKNVRRLWADGEVMRFVGFPEGLAETDEAMREWFERLIADRPAVNHFCIYENGEFCGETAYGYDAKRGSAWLDIKLFPFARGRGVAARALSTAIDRAFAVGAEAVWVDPHPENAKALALYRRLGFKKKPMPAHVAEMGEDAEATVYMELCRSEWTRPAEAAENPADRVPPDENDRPKGEKTVKTKKQGNNWTAYYDPETGRFFAEIIYTSREGREQYDYEITEDIYSRLGTFGDDVDNERLIKTAKMAYSFENTMYGTLGPERTVWDEEAHETMQQTVRRQNK